MYKLTIILALLLPLAAHAQWTDIWNGPPPSAMCSYVNSLGFDQSTGAVYTCPASRQWTQVSGSAPSVPTLGPCDVLAAAGTACVAAHSVARRMLASYTGPLFQIERSSDGTTLNVGSLPSGIVDTSKIGAFCAGTTCSYSEIFDQVGNGNNLPQATAANQSPYSTVTLGNGTVPIVTTASGQFYRNRTATTDIPKGNSSITVYMVVQNIASSTCCGTYGDVEANVGDDGAGTMFAAAYSTGGPGGSSGWTQPNGPGPWAGVDLENGVYNAGAPPASQYTTVLASYNATAPELTLGSGNAQAGPLAINYSGALPVGYTMALQGGLSLGEGGDSTPAPTSFLEGAVIASSTSTTTDQALQANIAQFYSSVPCGSANPCASLSGGNSFSGLQRFPNAGLQIGGAFVGVPSNQNSLQIRVPANNDGNVSFYGNYMSLQTDGGLQWIAADPGGARFNSINGPGYTYINGDTVNTQNLNSGTASNNDLRGSLTLASGAASYTFAHSYTVAPKCAASDTTAASAVKVTTTTTTLTLTGTGSDVIDYLCAD